MRIEKIFNEFIQVISDNKQYTIGLIDKNGYIVHSSSPEIQVDEVKNSTDDSDLLYPIIVQEKDYGILWVRSHDGSKEMVGQLLAESLKTRIAYEMAEDEARKSITIEEELLKHIISGSTESNEKLRTVAKVYGLDLKISRVAIVIKLPDDNQNIIDLTRLKYFTEKKDALYMMITSNEMLIYLGIPNNISRKNNKKYILNFILSLKEWGLCGSYYFIGSIQDDYLNYYISYRHVNWLSKHHKENKKDVCFFTDYFYFYLMDLIPSEEIDRTIDLFITNKDNIDLKEFIEVTNALFNNDFNITKTAESIFIHKNTLLYKIKKYEEYFNIDIRNSFQGKVTIVTLANYLSQNYEVGGR